MVEFSDAGRDTSVPKTLAQEQLFTRLFAQHPPDQLPGRDTTLKPGPDSKGNGTGIFASPDSFLSVPSIDTIMNRGRMLAYGQPPFQSGDQPGYQDQDPWRPGHLRDRRPLREGGPLRDRIRQRIQDLKNNPQAIQDVLNLLGGLSKDVRFNVDAQTKTISLGMDFTKLYDKMIQNNPAADKPELRKLAAGLDSFSLNPDTLVLNWKSEQLMDLGGDKGPAKGYKLALGGGGNRTEFNINTTDTKLTLSGIKGMEAVDPSGKRLKIHEITLDTTDKDKPKGSITIDNPVPKPKLLPASTPWPEKVSLPIMLSPQEQKPLVESLPGVIKTIDTLRNAAKTGDLKQLLTIQPRELMKLFGWASNIKDRVDIKAPDAVDPKSPGQKKDEPARPQVKIDDYLVKPLTTVTPLPVAPEKGKAEPSIAPVTVPEKKAQPAPDAVAPKVRRSLRPGGVTGAVLDSLKNRDNTPVKPSEAPAKTVLPDLGAPNYLDVLAGKKVSPAKPADAPAVKREEPPKKDSTTQKSDAEVKPAAKGVMQLIDTLSGNAEAPLAKELKARLADPEVRKKVAEAASTINRFDVDKASKSLTLGLDFAKIYDSLPLDKKTPEARKVLSSLDSVSVSPDSLKLNWRGGEQVVPIADENGGKKADLILGAGGGVTSFDLASTDTSLTLKNIKGLQAEVKLLGKKLSVHEVKIDASNPNKPVATVTVDNPFDRPASVSEALWQKTMTLPLELNTGDARKDAELQDKLPKAIKAINAMRERGRDAGVAEELSKLTKEELKKLLSN